MHVYTRVTKVRLDSARNRDSKIQNSRSVLVSLPLALRRLVSCPVAISLLSFLPPCSVLTPLRVESFFSFIPLSSPLNFSRSYLLSLFPPVHSSFRVPSLFSLLYYSLPLVAPLFILARGELRDDNGKSKGFVWGGAGGREG